MGIVALILAIAVLTSVINRAATGETLRSGFFFTFAIPFILIGVVAGGIAYALDRLGGENDF